MSRLFVKTIDKLQRIDRMINLKATGSPKDLAKRLCISQSTLYEYLLILKQTFHAPLEYCRFRKSYYYRESGVLYLGFKK
jgi:hypothetical protein